MKPKPKTMLLLSLLLFFCFLIPSWLFKTAALFTLLVVLFEIAIGDT